MAITDVITISVSEIYEPLMGSVATIYGAAKGQTLHKASRTGGFGDNKPTGPDRAGSGIGCWSAVVG